MSLSVSMKPQWIKFMIAVGTLVGEWGCQVPEPAASPYEEGVYIINAGNPSGGNGTLTFVPRSSKTVVTDVFKTANPDLALSGLAQNYAEVNGKGLILVDNGSVGQDRVEIVEIGTFRSRASLGAPDIENPREVVGVGPNKAYVSCWDALGNGGALTDPGYVAVINLNDNTVTKKIPAVRGVERMVVSGSDVFVGSSAASGNNTLLILDVNTDAVKQRVDFSAPPQPIALDADGKVWILTGREMIRLDPTTRIIEKRLTFPGVPNSVTIGKDRQTFYYTLNGATHRFTTISTFISTANPIINRSFNALGVDPRTDVIYGSVIPSYTQAGYVLRYQSDGALIDTVRAEIAPSKFFFQ